MYKGMNVKDRYKQWFDDKVLQRRYNPYKPGDTVILFIVMAKDRESFMWKCGVGKEGDNVRGLHTLAITPLKKLGFTPVENQLGKTVSKGENIIMMLEDQTRFWEKLTGLEMKNGPSAIDPVSFPIPVFPASPASSPAYPPAPPPVFSPATTSAPALIPFPSAPLTIPGEEDPLPGVDPIV